MKPRPDLRELWRSPDLRRIFWLLAGATLVAVAVNWLRPAGLAWWGGPEPGRENSAGARVAEISTAQMVRYSLRGGAVLVDARNAQRYAEGHVAGAVNVPAGQAAEELGKIFTMLPSDQLVVIYCSSSHCGDSRSLAEFLIRNGYQPGKLRVYPAGWDTLETLPRVPKARGGQQP